MSAILSGERMLTELDFARLSRLDDDRLPGDLAAGLAAADLTSSREVPADVVTMYSQVVIRHGGTGTKQKLTLCYPEDAEPAEGFVSVLSPVGASLLGLRVGATARWQTPHGDERRATIESILFQPEASGDYTL